MYLHNHFKQVNTLLSQTDLFDPLQVRVDLEVMITKSESPFSKSPGLEPHHQIQFSIIDRTSSVEGFFNLPAGDAVDVL